MSCCCLSQTISRTTHKGNHSLPSGRLVVVTHVVSVVVYVVIVVVAVVVVVVVIV